MNQKTCIKCKDKKDIKEFELSYNKRHPQSRRRTCITCRNKERCKYDTRYGNGLRNKTLKYYYNISLDDYIEIHNKQNGLCSICKKENTSGPHTKKLVVDHCHKTGKVRGLLCDKCNRALGQFDDDIERLLSAINYLKISTTV